MYKKKPANHGFFQQPTSTWAGFLPTINPNAHWKEGRPSKKERIHVSLCHHFKQSDKKLQVLTESIFTTDLKCGYHEKETNQLQQLFLWCFGPKICHTNRPQKSTFNNLGRHRFVAQRRVKSPEHHFDTPAKGRFLLKEIIEAKVKFVEVKMRLVSCFLGVIFCWSFLELDNVGKVLSLATF